MQSSAVVFIVLASIAGVIILIAIYTTWSRVRHRTRNHLQRLRLASTNLDSGGVESGRVERLASTTVMRGPGMKGVVIPTLGYDQAPVTVAIPPQVLGSMRVRRASDDGGEDTFLDVEGYTTSFPARTASLPSYYSDTESLRPPSITRTPATRDENPSSYPPPPASVASSSSHSTVPSYRPVRPKLSALQPLSIARPTSTEMRTVQEILARWNAFEEAQKSSMQCMPGLRPMDVRNSQDWSPKRARFSWTAAIQSADTDDEKALKQEVEILNSLPEEDVLPDTVIDDVRMIYDMLNGPDSNNNSPSASSFSACRLSLEALQSPIKGEFEKSPNWSVTADDSDILGRGSMESSRGDDASIGVSMSFRRVGSDGAGFWLRTRSSRDESGRDDGGEGGRQRSWSL